MLDGKLCSPEHAARLKALHERDPNFGVIGHLWAPKVTDWMIETNSESLLDYGCGRSNLAPAVACEFHNRGKSLQHRHEYDPAFGHRPPDPADFVTCIDVLEHVEAGKLIAVLLDIQRCVLKAGLITVSLRNRRAKGYETHPNVAPREWWLAKLSPLFKLREIKPLNPTKAKSELAVLVEPYRAS